MPKPRVYIETTIPSAYYTNRTDAAMLARRDATRRWWEQAVAECELVTSGVVSRELGRGKSAQVPQRLALLEGLELLEPAPAVRAIARGYILHSLMPAKPPTDALHLELASHYRCDILVTWNYRHLANVHKLDRIRRLNTQLGLVVPVLTTPSALLGENDGTD